MRSMSTARRTFCTYCDEMVAYKLDEAKRWECTECGYAIDCTSCGQTMHGRHQCVTDSDPERH
jgi:hypothetical protein